MAHSAAVNYSVGNEAVWETVVSAVAETTGEDPLAMDPLYDALDPDALDALFAQEDVEGVQPRLTFTYCGCEVVVSGDGVVRVEPTNRTNKNGGVA